MVRALLNYALFSDLRAPINWGNSTGSVSGNGAGSTGTNCIRQVAAGQYVTPGAYTDTVTATVTY